ncbi:MAG: DedA family protein [Prevotellaceae bacterium]|jgi:membrane-associated protein|nr:DedA family protein [Prevotellaceae bacterium]
MDFIIDFILHIDEHLEYIVNTYHLWTYAILFLIIFCETGLVVTPFLPGDSLIFAAGAIVAREGVEINVHLLALVLFAAAVLGDTCNYEIGRFFGKRLFSNPHSKIFKQVYLERTHEFYKKYGGKTIILARFVPIVRTFAPFVAGMGRMHYFYFLSYNVTGGALWVAIFCYVGFFFGNVPFVQEHFGLIAIAIIIISVLPAIVEVVRERSKAKKAKAGGGAAR